MRIELHRGPERGREARSLPAAVYNLAHTILARGGDAVFVPVRSLQVLAIIDRQEIVFVDSRRKHLVETAWQNFNPGRRGGLDEPVAYEVVHYGHDSVELMPRLQVEFAAALRALAGKSAPDGDADVLNLPTEPNPRR